ncbi:serine/threonine-protein kinase Chk2-like [Ostrea edulis]|uniref:serine/threonine-protein kinase Chk2-like n=1 Tax=Ostrea edulis TaxID=37623 RepID=UPI00209580B8|nr:serine/threonine-protein kinase Chk2-like [Ostrea edulis]
MSTAVIFTKVKDSCIFKKGQDSQSTDSNPHSSMETVPTDFIDGDFSEEDDADETPWARLMPLGEGFVTVDLKNDDYSFGRGENCDVSFSIQMARTKQCFQAYSKVHFKLIKQQTSSGVFVFLEDTSSNGTFINGEKVGKGNKQALKNNDEIALALKKNKAYMYLDLSMDEDGTLPQLIRDKYTLGRTLGKGACGEVKIAFSKGACERFAVKIISKKKFTVGGNNQVNLSQQVMNEVNLLKALKHPCIIKIEDVVDTPDVLYIILELVDGGELFDKVVSIGQYDEPTAKLIFYQMVCAVKYLHDEGITHRDLKPENILLATEENESLIKVTDFGLSKFVDAGSMMKTFCGTPSYLAPEILLTVGMGAYTKAIDCWSLGVILYICLAGYPPFSDEREDMSLDKQIKEGHYTFPTEYWKGISEPAIDLIKKLLTVDPKKRITLAEVVNHPWFKDDAMKKKANNLMFPESGGMAPPLSKPGRKRSLESTDECSAAKRQISVESAETNSTSSLPSTP